MKEILHCRKNTFYKKNERQFQANLKKLISTSVPFILLQKLFLCSDNIFSAYPNIEELYCKFRSADFFVHIKCEPCIRNSFSASTSHKLMAKFYSSSFLIHHIHFRNVDCFFKQSFLYKLEISACLSHLLKLSWLPIFTCLYD